MRPYMTESNGKPEVYRLYGVVVHAGESCYSGHVYSYVKASDGHWYKMDDDTVSLRSRESALAQKAYILFYVRSPKQSNCEEPAPLSHTLGQCTSDTLSGPDSKSVDIRNGQRTPCSDGDNTAASNSVSDDCLDMRESGVNSFQHREYYQPKKYWRDKYKHSERNQRGKKSPISCDSPGEGSSNRKRKYINDNSEEDVPAKKRKGDSSSCDFTV
ncbi:uncharacterized protein [Hoplias malabaricus]|uniref:uncharacterized protein n=1 Tax=Hoplias malabaricus TaxID=27720 RepID=UPI0034637A9C